jgi:hypothetical protein
MRDKDLIYVGIIAYLAYLLLNKNKKEEVKVNGTKTNPVGNASNGGLNLPSNMGLPNLTPTPPDGLSTEDALNESNISPLIKDNEPEQLFGSYNLPTPYNSTPVITPPQSQEIVSNQTLPTDNVGSVINTPILEAQPTPAVEITEPPKPVGSSIIEEPILPIKVIKPQISDEEYTKLMKFFDYKDRLRNIESNIKQNKKLARGGDDLSSAKNDSSNLLQKKADIEKRIEDLVASSEYLQRRQAPEDKNKR